MKKAECPYDRVIQEDIEFIAESNVPFDKMKDCTVLVTGATGLIGSQIVLSLIVRNRLYNTNIRVIALARNGEKAEEKFCGILNDKNLVIKIADVLNKFDIEEDIDYIIHCAGVTGNPKLHVTCPANTINTAVIGTLSVLEIAVRKNIKGMVYLSSWEVYGTPVKSGTTAENDYGYIDLENVRTSYKESKRICEQMCISYATQYNLPVTIGRIAIAFGAGVSEKDMRFFAQFARSVINKEDIVLHTKGETVRSHCYVRDVITALYTIMLKGEKGKAYNIANKNASKSISEMAEMLAENYPDIKVVYDITEDVSAFGYNNTLKCILDTKRLEGLGWKPSVELPEMFGRMIESFKCR